jgi:hypothetical protein
MGFYTFRVPFEKYNEKYTPDPKPAVAKSRRSFTGGEPPAKGLWCGGPLCKRNRDICR